jgi:RimJ/RimL family protein N-acetyltransferase
MISTFADCRVIRKVGFKEIGRRRQAVFRNGEFPDVVFRELLAEDFGPIRMPALRLE